MNHVLRTFRPAATALALCFAGLAHAQPCIFANPSFEVGSGLEGWSTGGDVTLQASLTVHGFNAVSIGGPNTGTWDISTVWQPLQASPGSRFDASVYVGHSAANPVTGDAKGVVNIEWRNAAGTLISYESHDVLLPSDPTDEMTLAQITSGPAPAGTVSARLLLAMLQSPAQEPGRVVFDLANFIEQTSPSYDETQWDDFPGGRVVQFGGYDWRVKGSGTYGPGPNYFSDSSNNIAVTNDELTVSIKGTPGNWSSSELTLTEPLGYGDYIFTTRGDLDTLDPNVILGLFLWQYPVCYDGANQWNEHNEIDVEISRWGNPGGSNAQFVTQPYYVSSNIERFNISYSPNEVVSYAFRWAPDQIAYRAWRGGPNDESPETLIREWIYTGQHLPTPELPRVHINLWHINGGPASSQTVIIQGFVFREYFDCDADLNGDGVLDNGDIGAFIELFLNGC